jgi:hypothetical protein
VAQKRKPALITDIKVENPGLNITYPKVSGLKHKSAESGINRYIKKEVHRLIKHEGYGIDENKKFTGDYTVKLNRRGTISIIFELFSFVKGSDRGTTIRRTFNLSLKDARVYYIHDLFSRKVKKIKYISRLNDLIKNQIEYKGINLSEEFNSIDSEQQYYLTENSLVIYFDPCALSAGDYGFPEFEIPFFEIEDIINTKGPIGRLLKDKDEADNKETADE